MCVLGIAHRMFFNDLVLIHVYLCMCVCVHVHVQATCVQIPTEENNRFICDLLDISAGN